MEEGESPTEAGARELLEETGYGDATRLTLIASLSPQYVNPCQSRSHCPYRRRVVDRRASR